MNNIITAAFGYGNTTKTREVWKIDHGMKLQIRGIRLPAVYQVHFANHLNIGEASVVVATSDTVDIPDIYFSTGKDVYAWIYLTPASGIGYTVYMATIPVRARPLISQYEPTPVQESAIDQAIGALNEAVAQTGEDAAAAGLAKDAAEAAQAGAEAALGSALAAQGAAEAAAVLSSQYAAASAASATAAGASAGEAQQAQAGAEAARDTAGEYAENAAASAADAAQAATTAGYMRFEIDERGHLIYTRVGYHDTMFSLRDGHLILGVS